mmetsp:Transcript_34689/g.40899  ORF Transcript_34689/g.40899 Transcript_34689/m.40899 type:complete len:227 (+) Transcript_34689:84-764(+)
MSSIDIWVMSSFSSTTSSSLFFFSSDIIDVTTSFDSKESSLSLPFSFSSLSSVGKIGKEYFLNPKLAPPLPIPLPDAVGESLSTLLLLFVVGNTLKLMPFLKVCALVIDFLSRDGDGVLLVNLKLLILSKLNPKFNPFFFCVLRIDGTNFLIFSCNSLGLTVFPETSFIRSYKVSWEWTLSSLTKYLVRESSSSFTCSAVRGGKELLGSKQAKRSRLFSAIKVIYL